MTVVQTKYYTYFRVETARHPLDVGPIEREYSALVSWSEERLNKIKLARRGLPGTTGQSGHYCKVTSSCLALKEREYSALHGSKKGKVQVIPKERDGPDFSFLPGKQYRVVLLHRPSRCRAPCC